MRKLVILICLLLGMTLLAGCSEAAAQIETLASQIDVESIVTEVIESIDLEELKGYAQQGYDALTEKYPSLKSENVKAFLKENGLKLMNSYIESSDAQMQENSRKLGQIIKILYPELTDEVDAVLN